MLRKSWKTGKKSCVLVGAGVVATGAAAFSLGAVLPEPGPR